LRDAPLARATADVNLPRRAWTLTTPQSRPNIPDNGMISAMRKKINSRGRLMRQA